MKIKDIKERFEELYKEGKINCTESELQDFLISGILFKKGSGYVTKTNTDVDVNIFTIKAHNMNINLQDIMNTCLQLAKENKINRIYCMNINSYNKYKDRGLIINKDNKDYYQLFGGELWLIKII